MKPLIFLFLFTILQGNSASLWAQNAPEELALEKDDFEDAFFESLKQKGIENYDKAIIELEKCLKIQPNNATIYFELGKNYFEDKEYKKAYESF
jgi:tetratricopeptide (TPR) repeat protein